MKNPIQWSVGDVQSWLCYSLTSILGVERGTNSNSATNQNIIAIWNIDGQRLCSMAEEDFHRRDPLNGEKIFANLELLKMAQWKSADLQQTHNQQQSVSQQQEINSNGQMSGQQPFDLGRILLDSVTSSAGAYGAGCASPASCSGSSSMEHSPSPPTTSFVDIKVELDDSLNQAGSNCASAKFSNPSSVDTSSSMRNSDDDEDEEEEEEKPVVGAGKAKACGTKNGAHIHLWQFLKELLVSGQQHGSCIRWLDQSRGVFKIEDSVRVARLWGIRKNRPAMNYDKLSRSIRQYYRKGIMRKTERSQRLVYQFCHPYGL
ncbi:DNA-binding protein D-ETS-4 [Orchesella cincta]|uniref:DNA-binding protein D-ETS-4 n=1 Tax=Orchesella cincta TaxID=48709 RepID=A0A1D2NAZ0_ORCCI|nr:DNA-binding protein D-ETS-4 [Orchesella cincta]